MEEKGMKFYKKAVRNCKNNITKKTFAFLAENEKLHQESIKEFYNTLKEKGEFPSISLGGIQHKRMEDLSIFSKSIKELKDKLTPVDDDKKACEFAMEFENHGYKYYESMLKAAKDKNLVKLLKFLLSEESEHYEAINELHTYLTDPHNWYMYEEGIFPQGG
jgi:rubrerythrin